MSPLDRAPPLEAQPGSSGDLAALQAAVSSLTKVINTMRVGEADVRQGLRSLAARTGKLERESRIRADSDTRRPWPTRPVPVDPENPTDEEIRVHILNQLYQGGCWNGKHTSGLNLARGYLDKVERRRVDEEIRRLRSQGVLLVHAKSPDEHFSLNPGESSLIYRALGIPERRGVVMSRTPQDRRAPNWSDDDPDQGASTEYVELGRFQNTVKSIRSAIEQDGRASGHLGERLEQTVRESSERRTRLEGRLESLELRLEVLERRATARSADSARQPIAVNPREGTVEGAGE